MQNSAAEIEFRLVTTGRPAPKTVGVPRSTAGRLPRVTQVLALAIHFQDMIQRGEARDYADLARLGCLTRERMSQIMELVWLAPDIAQEILQFPPSSTPRFPLGEVAARQIACHLDWHAQRESWRKLKQQHHLE
jgi:hypothetical protein